MKNDYNFFKLNDPKKKLIKFYNLNWNFSSSTTSFDNFLKRKKFFKKFIKFFYINLNLDCNSKVTCWIRAIDYYKCKCINSHVEFNRRW